MEVAIVYNTAWYIYNFRLNLIGEIQRAGHSVVAICPYDEYVPKLEALGVKHHALELEGLSVNPLRELKSLLSLYTLLKKINPSCVLSFTVKCNLYSGFCRRILKFRHVANISGLGQAFDRPGILRSFVSLLYQVAFKRSDAIFFQNKEDLGLCNSHNLVLSERCQLLPGSGVDLQRFVPVGPRKDETVRFLMFGRLLPKKGYDDFLYAASALKKKFGSKAEFQIMGVVDERRPESVELASRVTEAAKQKVVLLIPKAIDVLPVLQAADVVVLPSTYNEGVPRSLLEALGCGKPIVTTDWKGCRETVEEGYNGFLVPINDRDSLARALERFVTMSAEDLQKCSNASRELATRRFDEGQVIKAYMQQVSMAAS